MTDHTEGVLTTPGDDALSDMMLNDALDAAWTARVRATEDIITYTAAHLLRHVRAHVPAAFAVVVREDTSHLPAHGHVDRIEAQDGTVLVDTSEHQWHDLPWSSEADEDAWDIYHCLGASGMTRDVDGVRRIRIVQAE